MRTPTHHDLALGIVLLARRTDHQDAVQLRVREWMDSPTGSLREVFVECGVLPEDEFALAEQAAVELLERGHLESAGISKPPPTVRESCGNPEPSLPLFDDVSAEDGQVAPGQVLGESLPPSKRYRILRRHAGGGLGEVFVARDEELGRDVAVKRIREEYAAHSDLQARFLLEAEITGLVDHPGIVPVYGRGCDAQGYPFYAMRFIQGETLQQAIVRYHGPGLQRFDQSDAALELRRLLRHFVDVCNAMAYVHHRGVIHRDLKPENIMIGPYGETFVLDWGLAKIVGRDENAIESGNSTVASETPCKTLRPPSAQSPVATQVGSAIGTLAYMSPEQAAGLVDQLRPTSDLYSHGAILYAILTGQPPVQGTDPEVIRQNVLLNRFPRPREVRPAVPAPLEAVCLKAMALDPQQRYQSAKEIADEIEAWMADEPVRAWREPLRLRAARWVRRHRSLVVGAAAAMVVAVISLSVGMALLAKANQRVRHSESIAVQREEDSRWNFQLARNAVDRYLTQVSQDERLKAEDLEPLRRDLLQTASAFYEQFIRQEPDDPDVRAAWGWAHYRLASITGEIGSKREAIPLLNTAINTFVNLGERYPDNAGYQEARIRAMIDLARMYAETGDPQTAAGKLNTARSLTMTMQEKRPDLPAFSEALADCYDQSADLGRDSRNDSEAETALLAAIALRRRLIADVPDAAQLRSSLAANLGALGALYCQGQRYSEAATCLSEAATLQERLVDEHRHSATYLSALATTCDQMVTLYNQWSEIPGQTETAMLAALRVRQRLVREHPAVTEYQARLAASQHALAQFYLEASRPSDAEAALLSAQQLYDQLVESHSDIPEFSLALASVHRGLAVVLGQRKLVDETVLHCQEAARLLRLLGDRFPKQGQYPKELAKACCELGAAQVVALRPEEAGKAYETAIDAMEVAVPLSNVLAVADDAKWLASQPECDGPTAYRAAVLLAQAAEAITRQPSIDTANRDRPAAAYADAAVAALQKSAAAGYFADPLHRKQLHERDALQFLRNHDEYRKKLETLAVPP